MYKQRDNVVLEKFIQMRYYVRRQAIMYTLECKRHPSKKRAKKFHVGTIENENVNIFVIDKNLLR